MNILNVYHKTCCSWQVTIFGKKRGQVHRPSRLIFDNVGKMVLKVTPAIIEWGGMNKLGLSPLVLVNGNISPVKL